MFAKTLPIKIEANLSSNNNVSPSKVKGLKSDILSTTLEDYSHKLIEPIKPTEIYVENTMSDDSSSQEDEELNKPQL